MCFRSAVLCSKYFCSAMPAGLFLFLLAGGVLSENTFSISKTRCELFTSRVKICGTPCNKPETQRNVPSRDTVRIRTANVRFNVQFISEDKRFFFFFLDFQ